MSVLWLCCLILFSCVNGQCTTNRVRKSWYALQPSEKELYLDAIELAMDRGFHALFVEVHSNAISDRESHHTCGFLVWHRRFLLAYENMLRTLGPRFQCITVPYWDYFDDYRNFRSRQCSTFEACSPFLQDMGGSNGPNITSIINGLSIRGRCVNRRPCDHFCQSSQTPQSQCQRCVPRGNWAAASYPAEASLSQIVAALSRRDGYREFNRLIQENIHNQIHNTADAAMSTIVSVSDPIFFNHHCTIDMLYSIYYDCQVGQKQHFGFQNCPNTQHPSHGTIPGPQSTSEFQMRWSAASTPVDSHETLQSFFSTIPRRYIDLIDIHTLGQHSYTYEYDSLMNQLQASRFTCASRVESVTSRNRMFSFDWRRLTLDNGDSWIYKTLESIMQDVDTPDAAIEQLELMECLHHYEISKKIQDLSSLFRHQFHIKPSKHARCAQVLLELFGGQRVLKIKHWREFYRKF